MFLLRLKEGYVAILPVFTVYLEFYEKMNNEKQNICRLCLNNITDGHAEVIERSTVQFIDLVIPNLNLTISEEPVICGTCSECLKRCFVFKNMCLSVEDSIKCFAHEESEMTLSEVYKQLKGNLGGSAILEDKKICRLCLNLIASDFKLLKDSAISDMLLEYLPELNLKLCSDAVLCRTCLDTFRDYVTFTSACSNVEAEIAKYLDSTGLHPKGCVELAQVALFAQRNLESITNHSIEKTHIKTESNLIENVKTERIDNWDKQYFAPQPDFSEPKVNRCNAGNGSFYLETPEVKCEVRDEKMIEVVLNDVKVEPKDAEEDQGYFPCDNLDLDNEKTVIKEEQNMEDLSSSGTAKDGDSAPFAHNPASPDAKGAAPSDPPLPTNRPYKCDDCTYTTKYHAYLVRHAKSHKDKPPLRRRRRKSPTTYQCAHCDYTTPQNHRLKEHSLTHKDPSEVELFECKLCGLKTKWRSTLRKHLLTHKDKSEVTTFPCDICPYISRSRDYLQRHMYVHKSGPLLQCGSCSFQTKYESYLRRHAFTHNPSAMRQREEPVRGGAHVCAVCGYEAGRKSRLREHMLTHQGSSEACVYQCERCDFQTKWKNSFKKHKLVHEKGAGGPTFACALCDYTTISRCYLNRHSMVHKDATQMEMHRCALCGFATKTKPNLKSHMLRHAEPEEAPVFECGMCGYKTRRKGQLAQHIARHGSAKKGKVFRCGVCGFQTKWAQSLKVHRKTHKE